MTRTSVFKQIVGIVSYSFKVAHLLRSAACLHTNQSRSYLNHLVESFTFIQLTFIILVDNQLDARFLL